MTAPEHEDVPLPDVGTVDDTGPVVLEDAGEPDEAYLKAAVAHLKGRDGDDSLDGEVQ